MTSVQASDGRSGYEPCISVLAVGLASDDVERLNDLASFSAITVREASGCSDAHDAMRRELPAVVVADSELSDGSWRDLLAGVDDMSVPPPVIVVCRLADERLWAEVLNSGGYDLLAKPLEAGEVLRTLAAASRHRDAAAYGS